LKVDSFLYYTCWVQGYPSQQQEKSRRSRIEVFEETPANCLLSVYIGENLKIKQYLQEKLNTDIIIIIIIII